MYNPDNYPLDTMGAWGYLEIFNQPWDTLGVFNQPWEILLSPSNQPGEERGGVQQYLGEKVIRK